MSDPFDAQARIEDLEMMAAHQARTIEDLSAELKKAFDSIVALQRSVKLVSERFQTLEEAALPRPEATKPPHY